jgi:hypothetical protein
MGLVEKAMQVRPARKTAFDFNGQTPSTPMRLDYGGIHTSGDE